MRKSTTKISSIAALLSLMFLSPMQSNAQDEGSITMTTSVDKTVITPGSTVTITFVLDKGYLGGLCRLDEFMPHGFKAIANEVAGAHFYVSDTIVHFAWSHLPYDPTITISYDLIVPSNALGNYTLTPQFIYVAQDGAHPVYFKPYTITVQPALPVQAVKNVPLSPAPASSGVVSLSTKKDTSNNVTVHANIENKAPANPAPSGAKVASNSSSHASPADVPKPAKTMYNTKRPVCYRVQIMATSEHLDADSVIINGIRDRLYITDVNGIYKYAIGSF